MSMRYSLLLLPLLFACNSTAALNSRVPADLEDLVRVYQEGSGVNVTYDEATRAQLAAIPVRRVGVEDLNVIQIGPLPAQAEARAELIFEVLPLQHADATRVAQTLDNLLGAATRSEEIPVRVLSDQRTNALLISASKSGLARVRDLVVHLDVAIGEG